MHHPMPVRRAKGGGSQVQGCVLTVGGMGCTVAAQGHQAPCPACIGATPPAADPATTTAAPPWPPSALGGPAPQRKQAAASALPRGRAGVPSSSSAT